MFVNIDNPRVLHDLLCELENALISERDALRALDRGEIERLAQIKLGLNEQLREAAATSEPDAANQEILVRIRVAAQVNQLLLVHARNCVQGVLGLFADPNLTPSPNSGPMRVPPRPVAVSIKG